MKFLTKFFRTIRASRLWVRALSLASEGDDESALACLLSFEQLGLESLSLKKPIYVDVLKITILGRLSRLDEAIVLVPGVLNSLKENKTLARPEKDYLALALWKSVGTLEEAQLIFKNAGYDKSLVEAGTSGVSTRLQKMFPL